MREDSSQHPATPKSPLPVEEQLRVLRDRRADVADLLELDIEHDEALVARIADDLVGARLVILAALLAAPPHGVSGAAREQLREREREARDLLGVVLAALHPWWGGADAPGG